MQENFSTQMVRALDAWRQATETWSERMFLGGLRFADASGGGWRRSRRDTAFAEGCQNPLHSELLQKRIDELKSRIAVGGVRAALIRGLMYAGVGRASIDERGFEIARQIRRAHGDMPIADFKALVREQFNILLIDQEAALAAIPSMLPPDTESREKAYDIIAQIMGARGELSADAKKRMGEVAKLFGVETATRKESPPSGFESILKKAAECGHRKSHLRKACRLYFTRQRPRREDNGLHVASIFIRGSCQCL
jgi:hypothetical protein